jgi:chemotaxis protein methyltransferase CheR
VTTQPLGKEAFSRSELVCPPAIYDEIARVLYSRTGINLPVGNSSLVVSRLVKHLRQLRLPDFDSYLRHITMPEHRDDLNVMISALTTNTTRFYREPYHFEIFAETLLPDLILRAKGGERIRLWSAGCSTGEEPYSLAATLLHHWPELVDYDVRILATDISTPALATAHAARYPRDRLSAVPEAVRMLMLSETPPDEPMVTMPQLLRDLVSVRYLNFVEPWPTRGPFQAIFCRNVAIYMDDRVQLTVWSGLIDLLASGGLLFIGHSERLPPSQADRVSLIERTTFRRP